MYRFIFSSDKIQLELPISPESFVTKVQNNNRIINTVGFGDINIIKNIGLRQFSFRFLLPQYFEAKNPPVYYLDALRELKASGAPFLFNIFRTLPNGTAIFNGNINVTVEEYTVTENAGEEGDFWVDIVLMEYRCADVTVSRVVQSKDGKTYISQEVQRSAKEAEKTYTVVRGDSLWKIAKLKLNDGSRYREIAQLNNISNPDKIYVGMVLKLP